MKYRNLLTCLLLSLVVTSCMSPEEKYARSTQLGEKLKKECGKAPRNYLGKKEDPNDPQSNSYIEYYTVRCTDGKNYLIGAHDNGVASAVECEEQSIETSSCWDQIK